MTSRCLLVSAILLLAFATGANAARYQRTKDGKTIVWNNLRGVAQEVTWSGRRDLDGYATGEGTLTWYRLGNFVNSYTGKMVRGRFEGPVIREQGQTRLRANFANGEKVSPWVEPGSATKPGPTPTPKEKPSEAEEAEPVEEPSVELPSPSPSPLPTATPMPRPTATPTPSPSPTPTATPTAIPTATPLPVRSASPSTSTQQSPEKTPRMEETGEGPTHDSLQLAISPSSTRNALVEVPRSESSPSAKPQAAARTSPTPAPKDVDAKRRLIAEFKQQTDSVLADVRNATGNFRELNDLEKVQGLPAAVSAKVTLLANQSREFRANVGYETAVYECLAQIETVEALIRVDLVTRDLAAKDAPVARKKLANFLEHHARPPTDDQKPLWRYLASALSACNRAKDEAESHLKQARSFEASGKKTEALREYREIYHIYPNPITAESIRELEKQSR